MVKVRYLVVFLILFVAVNTGMVYAQSLDINDQSANAGDTVNFTISVNNAPNAVDAVQFDVSYDTSVLDFTNNFTKGSLVNSFTYFDVKENTGGQIRVAGITTTSLKAGTSGDVVKLEFTVKNCTNSTLTLTGLEDDLSGWSIGSGQFTCASSTATPTPTSTAKPSPTTTATPTPTPVTSPSPWGALSLSKSEAFLNGDSVEVKLADSHANGTSRLDIAIVKYRSSSEASSYSMILTETAGTSGTFIGTLMTSTSTDSTSTTPTVRAVANGKVTITYGGDVTASFTTKNFGAILAFAADSVVLGDNVVVSLYDPETNSFHTLQNLVNVTIKSTTDSSGTTLKLTETGNDTGSFLGTMKVSSDSTLINSNMKAAAGDTLTVTFTDNPDASGSVSTVTDTVSVIAAATPTSTPSPTPVASPTPITVPGVIEAEVSIKPKTINLKSKGKFKAFIELPSPYSVLDINTITLTCEGAEAIQTSTNADRCVATFNIRDLDLGFEAKSYKGRGGKKVQVEFTVSGELEDGTKFEGSDTVMVKKRK